ncbi:hypothetical protein JD844_021863 [Phrynosoma platyrhinos]|uniref:Protein SAAL1 n=1 Tax=Phrynosoma platyrhinos TaxID=52577 RepID=A0ABQ7SUG3_PHRPL|nr:hypothetical protein JD844_021863 [Phrynosoma platyrhinos]
MDRNPSPPSSDSEEEAEVAGDSIGNTVYSKHWLFSVLTKLIEFLTPKKDDASELNNVEEDVELEEDMENVICKVWDMSMDKDVALFLQEFNAPDIFMGVFAKAKCPRLTEICVGILGNMACCQEVCVSISKDENLGQMVLQRLCDSDSPTLLETCRLLLTCLCQSEVADIWVKRIRERPFVYDCICFIMSSSTNVELLVKIGEVVDKLFDLDEELMLDWIKKGSRWSVTQPVDDSPNVTQPVDDSPNEHQVLKIVPCLLEATKQIRLVLNVAEFIILYCRSENHSEGLDVYMHILQLLTTVDEGIQAIDMPLIDSLIRVLQNMDECVKRSGDSLNKSKSEEPEKLGMAEEDFHLKIVKDICCELLSTMLQEMSKVKSFLEVLHEVDQALAESLEKNFPSLKLQT